MTQKRLAMSDAQTNELLQLNQRLLDSIAGADWATYEELCDPSLTAFEPEAKGQLVEGLAFHRFYFDLGGVKGPHQTTMAAPHVRLLGDVALVTYVRLIQRVGADGAPRTQAFEETRLWHRRDGRWRHIHFHRTALGEASS
jgi:ketosteroid isomerase-like protein